MANIKSTMRKAVEGSNKPSKSAKATVNRAGGVAFEISDPATKLLTMTGGSFFAEPRYYDESSCVPTRLAGGKFGALAERLRLAEYKATKFAKCDDFDSVTKEILAAAIDVATGKNPRDLLALANWLRNEANIRLTPQVFLVVASRIPETQKFVREYAPKIVLRPDEVKTCLLLHRYFFGMKTVKNCLAQGLSDRMSQFGEKGLLKYDDSNFPKWSNVLNWLPRKNGRPLSKDLAMYFLTGAVTDNTPIARDRKALANCSTFNKEAKRLALASQANWEVLLSQFGGAHDKKELWSFLVENDLLGYMALLRNLRNISEAGVSSDVIAKVCAQLSDREAVLKSKQLPFRFLSAYREVSRLGNNVNKLLEAIEDATEISIENCPVIPGSTLVAIDVSGSMRSNRVSQNSEVTADDAAGALGAIIARRCADATIVTFAEGVQEVKFTKRDTVMRIVEKTKGNGGCTNTHLVIQKLIQEGKAPDRVVILSDMQAWVQGQGWGWGNSRQNTNCADLWKEFRQKVKGGKQTWMHSINVCGYGDTPIPDTDNRINLCGGFNEAVLDLMAHSEGIATEDGKALPSMEYIRSNF